MNQNQQICRESMLCLERSAASPSPPPRHSSAHAAHAIVGRRIVHVGMAVVAVVTLIIIRHAMPIHVDPIAVAPPSPSRPAPAPARPPHPGVAPALVNLLGHGLFYVHRPVAQFLFQLPLGSGGVAGVRV
jgi:hypothetical protein